MILKALYDYYNRCGSLPSKGLEFKEIGYVVVINNLGEFVRIDSRMIDKKRAEEFLVAQTVKRSGTKYIANYLWDNCDYVFGYNADKPDKATACKQKFIERINELKQLLPDNDNIKSIGLFYEKFDDNFKKIQNDELWNEIVKTTKNISFMLNGKMAISAVDSEILQMISSENSSEDSICLVSGQRGTTARIHHNIPFKGNAFSSLVSFQKNQGYDSYGKEQAYNAPVSEDAEFKYTTALNKLLEYDSNNQFSVGSRTFLFWASSNDEASVDAEESFFALFNSPKEETNNPNRRIDSVKKVFNDIYSGIRLTSDDDRFYFLGLAPNAARIAVVYWHECKLKDFAGIILRHFEDTDIIDARKEKDRKPYQGLYQLLSAVTLGGKSSDVQPNLPEAVVKSIMQGLPYPASLFQACIRRIRAEQQLTITRAAIIKAYLNRLNDNNKKLEIMLDKENTNVGYLCGRLFATLEKIQEDANHIHTIRERYLNSASATPAAVFATIMNLSVHHSEKLNAGHQIFFEKVKQEIISKLPADGFPPHLELQDQGRFFVGYYHQRQDFFTSKEANDAGVNEEIQNEE